jgi:hypothetical protein
MNKCLTLPYWQIILNKSVNLNCYPLHKHNVHNSFMDSVHT